MVVQLTLLLIQIYEFFLKKQRKNGKKLQLALNLYFLVKGLKMENANKRYYSRCMYGNYKPYFVDFENKTSFSRFKRMWLSIYRNIIPALKRLSIGLFLALAVISCRTQPPTVIQKEEIIWTYKDSITTRDSICYIPIERYVDIVPIYDTLVLENSISISRSWADTTNHLLRGELKNKNAIQYQVKYVERVIKNDSIVERKVPQLYPVVEEVKYVPWYAKISIVWTILTIFLLGLWAYMKFWKH